MRRLKGSDPILASIKRAQRALPNVLRNARRETEDIALDAEGARRRDAIEARGQELIAAMDSAIESFEPVQRKARATKASKAAAAARTKKAEAKKKS